jgi:glucokinase
MADKDLIVGVDLGGTNVSAGVFDGKSKLLGLQKNKTKAEQGSDAVIKRIVKTIQEALEISKSKLEDVAAVGIGAPGAIDVKRGVVLNAVNLRWTDFPLGKALAGEIKQNGLTVVVDNDVNVGTWGEYVAGAGRGIDDLLGVFVGTGIGGGLVLDGKLYHGHFSTAGEIGHIAMHPDGPLGRRTLENLASRTAVANLIGDLVRANRKSVITKLVEGNLADIRSRAIADAIKEKDELVTQVVQESAGYVGAAIANMVTVLSLKGVVLGGGLAEALGGPYLKWVRDAFERHVFPLELRDCKLKLSELGDSAGVVGAAALARSRVDS